MASELKLCPFCGGNARLVHNHLPDPPFVEYFFVECSNDDCRIKPHTMRHGSDEFVIALWNTRPETALEAQLATAQATITRLSAPVSDEEWKKETRKTDGTFTRHSFNALIAARKEEPNGK